MDRVRGEEIRQKIKMETNILNYIKESRLQ